MSLALPCPESKEQGARPLKTRYDGAADTRGGGGAADTRGAGGGREAPFSLPIWEPAVPSPQTQPALRSPGQSSAHFRTRQLLLSGAMLVLRVSSGSG